MSELVLYSNPRSRGRIARWMLEELGQPYSVHYLDYGTTMKSPDYLAINPMGKVPALVHDKAVVTETAAICAYLAFTFPEAGLGPQNDLERALFLRWMFFAAGPLEAAVTARSLKCEPPKDKAGTVGYGTYEDALQTLEVALSAGPYITGERFTAADVYVGAHVAWGLQWATIETRPAFEAYRDRVVARPAYIRATELDNAALVSKA